MRKNAYKTPMKLGFHAKPSPSVHRYEKSRHEDLPEPITDFERAQRMIAFISVIIQPIGDVGNAFCFTEFRHLCHQGVGRFLVKMALFRGQIQDRRDFVPVDQMEKAYRFIAEVGAYKVASTDKFAIELLGLFVT